MKREIAAPRRAALSRGPATPSCARWPQLLGRLVREAARGFPRPLPRGHRRRLPLAPGPRPDRGPDLGGHARLSRPPVQGRERPPAGPAGPAHLPQVLRPRAQGLLDPRVRLPARLRLDESPHRRRAGRSGQGVDEILGQEGLGYFFVDGHSPQGRRGQGGLPRPLSRAQAALGEVPGRLQARRGAAPRSLFAAPGPSLARPVLRPGRGVGLAGLEPGHGLSRRRGLPRVPQEAFPRRHALLADHLGRGRPGAQGALRPGRDRTPGSRSTPSHFVSVLAATLEGRDSSGAVVALYDTELFGHWWFEGPEWLYHVVRKLAAGPVGPMTAERRARGPAADDGRLAPRRIVGPGRLPLDLAQRRHGLDLDEDLPHRDGRGRPRSRAWPASTAASSSSSIREKLPARELRLAVPRLDLVGPRLRREPGRRALRKGPDPGRLARGGTSPRPRRRVAPGRVRSRGPPVRGGRAARWNHYLRKP
ncbi:MAG: hypothetical protein M0C28_26475 [Candidatus Moduliflexus flocculans]|nr:hypothetical protein [Candidatus Moduliflexus flocculans]